VDRKRGKPVLKQIKAIINQVRPGTVADELGIEKGDTLISINKSQPLDFIDYRYLTADDQLEIEIVKKNGEVWVYEIEKGFDEDLGLGFTEDTFDGIRNCVNKCIFCFVDQMPADMRQTLYVKDDDYRLSFLHGNFITLTNLSKKDLDRIIRMRLSPLYISVHCTNPGLRERMLDNPRAGRVARQISLLAGAGIDMHTQIVLCPGINDDKELERTINELASHYPHVRSIAVVPAGITRYNKNQVDKNQGDISLPALRPFTAREALEIINYIQVLQQQFLQELKNPLVFLADEFYVMAGAAFPASRYYGDYPQLENGVGLVRLFYDSFDAEKDRLPGHLQVRRRIALITGVSGGQVLRPIVERLNFIENLHIELIAVVNEFFGEQVTVAGLLTGRDVLTALKKSGAFDLVILPSVMCKRDEPVFLDEMTPMDLQSETGIPLRIVDAGKGALPLIEAVTGPVGPMF